MPDDLEQLTKTLAAAVAEADIVLVSAGSSVGARDETTAAVEALGEPGVFCHGLAIKPGKPTVLAEAAGVPVIGLPGNPLSALVVFRMVGLPVLRLVGGIEVAPPEPTVPATLSRSLASAAGRLDVVQVQVRDGVATPLFGHSALLSLLTSADGYVVVPEPATGLDSGAAVAVTLYHDVVEGWPREPSRTRESRSSATFPPPTPSPRGSTPAAPPAVPTRLDPVAVPVADALGRVTAEPVWATRSSPVGDLAAMDGIAVRAEATRGATPTTPLQLAPDRYVVVDTGDPMPDGFDAVVMREHVHYEGAAAEIMAAVPPYQHVRSIGEDVSAGELLLPRGTDCVRSTSPRPPRPGRPRSSCTVVRGWR